MFVRCRYPAQLHPRHRATAVELRIHTAGANHRQHPAERDTRSCLPPVQDSVSDSQQQPVGVVALQLFHAHAQLDVILGQFQPPDVTAGALTYYSTDTIEFPASIG